MGSRKERAQMLRETGILFAVTVLSGLLLGAVYGVTKEPIRLQQETAVQRACAAAFPAPAQTAGAQGDVAFLPVTRQLDDAFVEQLAQEGIEIGGVFRAAPSRSGGPDETQGLGWVVEARSKNGYGGDIALYVGVDDGGTVTGVSILELSETPGLGMEAPRVLAPQFAGKQAERFTYTKTGAASEGEVDAIASATVTTSAVVDAVNAGLRTARYLTEHPESWMETKGADKDE